MPTVRYKMDVSASWTRLLILSQSFCTSILGLPRFQTFSLQILGLYDF